MVPKYNLNGLDFPELVFFGILIYVACLILIICLTHWIRYKIFCPSSRQILHCDYIENACTCDVCPKCSLRQKARNVFCCNRQHSIYEQNEELCKFKCFKPDCHYLRCICCELYVENESTDFPVQK